MPQENDLYDALGTIVSHALSVGDGLQSEIRDGDLRGVAITRKQDLVKIYSAPYDRHFTAEFPIRISDLYVQHYQQSPAELEEDRIRFNLGEELPEAEIINTTAQMRTDEIPDEEKEAAAQQVTQQMFGSECRHEWLWTGEDNDIWNGVVFRSHLYPYEEDFTVTEYDRSIQSLLNTANTCANSIFDHIDLGIDDVDDDPDIGREFR